MLVVSARGGHLSVTAPYPNGFLMNRSLAAIIDGQTCQNEVDSNVKSMFLGSQQGCLYIVFDIWVRVDLESERSE